MGTITESCKAKTGVKAITIKQSNKYFFIVQFRGQCYKITS